VGVRNIRRDVIEELRTMEKSKAISEDELHHLQNQVQKTTDTFIENIDKVIEAKDKEIMEI
jgi:ribosome recycling factor